jgi:geranylgeranylglycerol-phosphate geranylgeranyltransferase
VNRYIQLFRLGNCVMSAVALALAVLVAVGTKLFDHGFVTAVGAAVVFCFVAGGNSLNDYLDREVDRTAHPERPIPSGRIAPKTARNLPAAFFVVSFALSLLLDPLSIAIVASAILIMIGYELATKKLGLLGNLSIAWLTGALFLLGGALVGQVERTLIVGAMAFLATLGREIVKDIQDMAADVDRLTLPKRIGKRPAGVAGSVAFLAAVALSPVPYLTGMFGPGYLVTVLVCDAIFIYSSIVHFENPKKGQTWAKYGMAVALIAFLIGGIS